MKPIHKFNNGVGATLCHQCNCIASLGCTDDLYCNECNKHIELDEKGNPLTYWGGLKEPKQETLEEAAKQYAEIYKCPATNDNEYCRHDIISAINFGAKWQQEKMYSEEDMRKAFKSSSLTNMLDVYESFEEFIEQFKNK